jgi:hypothetical protein
LRSKLLKICRVFRQAKLDAELYGLMCRRLAANLQADDTVVMKSLLSLQGRQNSLATFETVMHRLAAHSQTLKAGKPSYPWISQSKQEWVLAQVLNAVPRLSSQGEPGALLTIKFMTGSPAGLVVKKWQSLRACRGMSRRMGFPRPAKASSWEAPKILYRIPDDLVTLRFEALLDPTMSKEEPGYLQSRKSKDQTAWNHKQLRHRYRVSPDYTCPRQHSRKVYCHNCPASLKECRAATRQESLVKIDCATCKKNKWAYTDKHHVCLTCLRLEAYYYESMIKEPLRVKVKNVAEAVQEDEQREDSRVGD